MTIATVSLTDRIPSPEECHLLMEKYYMLPNIIAHSQQVMRVALVIADNLKSSASINRKLVMAAALLHDITKTRSLKTKEPHDQSGGELLRELGFARVGEIVRQHVFLLDFNPQEKLEEREIIHYADKRVMHDKIVSVSERVEDIIERYGVTEEIKKRIRLNESKAYALEKKIASSMAVELDRAIQKIQQTK
ncbi:MAG: metal-dependent phosphohydrolase [Deltaproteobacteria bacterium HGW-Deltaproteobacteria-10]|nr:MAG: metal-dependent phosphohydrolase [Deltaproteobacteria bacterium HGW-Deltaproteobacteria-10]